MRKFCFLATPALLLAGCMTNAEVREARGETDLREQARPFAPPSSNLVIGKLSWLDPSGKQGVIELSGNLLQADTYLVTRNRQQENTGILKVSTIRRGTSQGVTVIYGTPKVGDELVMRAEGELLPRAADKPAAKPEAKPASPLPPPTRAQP